MLRMSSRTILLAVGTLLVTAAPMAAGDVNWCTVLAHHADRAPDKAMTIFEGTARPTGRWTTV